MKSNQAVKVPPVTSTIQGRPTAVEVVYECRDLAAGGHDSVRGSSGSTDSGLIYCVKDKLGG